MTLIAMHFSQILCVLDIVMAGIHLLVFIASASYTVVPVWFSHPSVHQDALTTLLTWYLEITVQVFHKITATQCCIWDRNDWHTVTAWALQRCGIMKAWWRSCFDSEFLVFCWRFYITYFKVNICVIQKCWQKTFKATCFYYTPVSFVSGMHKFIVLLLLSVWLCLQDLDWMQVHRPQPRCQLLANLNSRFRVFAALLQSCVWSWLTSLVLLLHKKRIHSCSLVTFLVSDSRAPIDQPISRESLGDPHLVEQRIQCVIT